MIQISALLYQSLDIKAPYELTVKASTFPVTLYLQPQSGLNAVLLQGHGIKSRPSLQPAACLCESGSLIFLPHRLKEIEMLALS